MRYWKVLPWSLVCLVCVSVVCFRSGQTQSALRRITNTTGEGINTNPSISGDGRIIGFESTEDLAGSSGADGFCAISANISVDPATFFQLGRTRAVAPAISQDGSRIAFASKDDPLGTNSDGNSEVFLFNGSNLLQVTNTTPGGADNRVVNGNFQPSISDDGRFIAFSSNRNLTSQNNDGNLEIFLYESVPGTFTQLTNSTGIVGFSDAKISGDGSAIACIRDVGANVSTNRDLVKINRTNGSQTILAANVARISLTYGRAISDDGNRIVYSAETAPNTTQVVFYDGRSGNANRQVTSLGARSTEVPLHATISGDGKRIAFATRRAVTGFINSDNSVELYSYDIPTATLGRITNAPADADCFDGSSQACEVVSSLNDDGSTAVFNFPRSLSSPVVSGLENRSEIYATSLAARPPAGELQAIVNQASFGHEGVQFSAIATNSIAAAFGTSLANTTQQSMPQADGKFPKNVAGTTVTVNGRAAQILFVSPDRVYFVVPPETEIRTSTVIVTNADGFQSSGSIAILPSGPGIFTKSGDGLGEGVNLNADTLTEGPFDPTGGNLRLLIFATGVRNAAATIVNIGGRVVTPVAVNPSTGMPGLDELLVLVPADLRGTGTTNLVIQSDNRFSNVVTVSFTGDPSRDIFINEVLADPPDGIAGDANHDGLRDGTQDEFIEIVNGTFSELISLSGWTIRTRATGGTTETTRFAFAPGTFLAAGEAIVVFGGGTFNPNDPAFGCAQVMKASTSNGLSLTNSGLTILVRDAAGHLITQFSYGSSTGLEGDHNQSLTRSPDITGAFVQHASAAGANGRAYSPGLRVSGTPFGNCPGHLRTVRIAPSSATTTVGETMQFISQAFDEYERQITNVDFNVTSDNTTVATVESVTINPNTGVATASAKARNPGTAHISASATDGVTTVNSSQTTLTVTGPSLSINDVSQNEGDSGTTIFTFTVSLSTPAPVAVTFDIATQDNTATAANNDYVPRSLTGQTIPAGSQTYTFDVTVNGDRNIEPTETFFVNVTNISGASASDAQALGTIVTDDVPKLSINDVIQAEGNAGMSTFRFTVSSSLPAPASGINFTINTADGSARAGSDYVAITNASGSIAIGSVSTTVNVTVNGDTLVEAGETFFVTLSNVNGATVVDGQGLGTITNDDTPLLVISQVYGGGGNASATYTNDFIEIFNRGTTTIDFSVTPYSVQYAAATSNFSTNKTNLTSGMLLPGRYFLIQEASGGTTGVALPAPDVSGGTINLSATAGKVALVLETTNLTGSGCPLGATIVDFLGYGSTANCSEISPITVSGTNSNARSVIRTNSCTDTNNNSADFRNPTTAAAARNSATAPTSCP